MSLYNELKILRDKIEKHAELLNEKIEKLNDSDINNKDKKLSKWNKSKIETLKQLQEIDKKINKLLNKTHTTISAIKSDTCNNFFR